MPDDSILNNTANNVNINRHYNADIRQLKRAQRRILSSTAQLQHAQALYQNTIKEKIWRNSQHIALYLANDGEIDPCLFIDYADLLGKKIYLPILAPLKNSLYFAPYEAGQRLKLNRFNIAEPVCHPSKWKTAGQLDLLLLPLVAFDTHGNRMGMGGGFYDRTLAYLQHRRFWKKPTLVGLAHEVQKVGQLNTQHWDIPLDYIITEKRCYRV
jgi:5-formyltetrahydrofolate cyclo-ligase